MPGHATAGERLPSWLPPPGPTRLVVGYLAGVCLARASGLVLPLEVGSFALTLSVCAFPVLWWATAKLAVNPRGAGERLRVALAVAAGVAGDELLYLAVRASGVTYWSTASLAASGVLVVVAVTAVTLVDRTGDDDSPTAPDRRFAGLLAGVVALSLVGYRVSQTYFRLAGVPNEQRSLLVFGHEIHHASTGTLLLVVGALVLASRGIGHRTHRLAAVAAAVGCGFVADQYPYLFYAVMTDSRYFGDVSAVGAVLATGSVIWFLLYHYRRVQTSGNT
jgi:hypothetical protein